MWWRRRRRRMYQIPTPTKANKTSAPMMPPTIAPTWGLLFEASDTGSDDGCDDVEVGPSLDEGCVAVGEASELEDALGEAELEGSFSVVFVGVAVPLLKAKAFSRLNTTGGGVAEAISMAHCGTRPEGTVRLGEGVVPQFLSSSVEKSVQFKA